VVVLLVLVVVAVVEVTLQGGEVGRLPVSHVL
jgi:hypothetical protein